MNTCWLMCRGVRRPTGTDWNNKHKQKSLMKSKGRADGKCHGLIIEQYAGVRSSEGRWSVGTGVWEGEADRWVEDKDLRKRLRETKMALQWKDHHAFQQWRLLCYQCYKSKLNKKSELVALTSLALLCKSCAAWKKNLLLKPDCGIKNSTSFLSPP